MNSTGLRADRALLAGTLIVSALALLAALLASHQSLLRGKQGGQVDQVRPLGPNELRLTGAMEASHTVVVTAPFAGRVTATVATGGTIVKPGDPLLYISSPAVHKRLITAQDNTIIARTKAPPGLLSGKKLRQSAKAPVSPELLGEAQKEAARQLAEAQRQAAAGAIVASTSGRLSDLWVKPGSAVRAGQKLAVIDATSGALPYVRATRADGQRIQTGQRAFLIFADRPEVRTTVDHVELREKDSRVFLKLPPNTAAPGPGTPLAARLTLPKR